MNKHIENNKTHHTHAKEEEQQNRTHKQTKHIKTTTNIQTKEQEQ